MTSRSVQRELYRMLSDIASDYYPARVNLSDPSFTTTTTQGVNFTNILGAAFMPSDPKSVKKLLNLTVFFLRFWDLRA